MTTKKMKVNEATDSATRDVGYSNEYIMMDWR